MHQSCRYYVPLLTMNGLQVLAFCYRFSWRCGEVSLEFHWPIDSTSQTTLFSWLTFSSQREIDSELEF